MLMSAQINLDKLIVAQDRVLGELKNLFEGQVGKELLTSSLRQDVCNKVKSAGHNLLGGCIVLDHIFSLISVTHSFASPHILFFLSIPIVPVHQLDNFKLYAIKSLPLNYRNNSAVMLDLTEDDPYIAVGKKVCS